VGFGFAINVTIVLVLVPHPVVPVTTARYFTPSTVVGEEIVNVLVPADRVVE
jgi:hypothetical protein